MPAPCRRLPSNCACAASHPRALAGGPIRPRSGCQQRVGGVETGGRNLLFHTDLGNSFVDIGVGVLGGRAGGRRSASGRSGGCGFSPASARCAQSTRPMGCGCARIGPAVHMTSARWWTVCLFTTFHCVSLPLRCRSLIFRCLSLRLQSPVSTAPCLHPRSSARCKHGLCSNMMALITSVARVHPPGLDVLRDLPHLRCANPRQLKEMACR